jgi:hypothetical protein
LDRPTSGRYLLGTDDVSQMSDDALSSVRGARLGFVFQSYNLIQQLTKVNSKIRFAEQSRQLLAPLGEPLVDKGKEGGPPAFVKNRSYALPDTHLEDRRINLGPGKECAWRYIEEDPRRTEELAKDGEEAVLPAVWAGFQWVSLLFLYLHFIHHAAQQRPQRFVGQSLCCVLVSSQVGVEE